MSTALVSQRTKSGLLPAILSALLPGAGQLLNRQSDKAIGVAAVYLVAGASWLGALPLLGPLAGLVASGTWLYAVADGYLTGKKRS